MEDLFTRTLSPGELAQIVGVSQSSIRRWVDDGVIDVTRTTGGHRRILLYEALRFIREQGMPVLRPELLGVPELGSRASAERVGPLTGDVLFRLLQDGEAAKARGAIVGAFVDGMSLASLFDGPIARALAQIGTLWKHSEEGIFVEHVATGVCLEAVNRLRVLLPPPSSSAPVALGGAPSGDPYLLPSLMAATVVAGWLPLPVTSVSNAATLPCGPVQESTSMLEIQFELPSKSEEYQEVRISEDVVQNNGEPVFIEREKKESA